MENFALLRVDLVEVQRLLCPRHKVVGIREDCTCVVQGPDRLHFLNDGFSLRCVDLEHGQLVESPVDQEEADLVLVLSGRGAGVVPALDCPDVEGELLLEDCFISGLSWVQGGGGGFFPDAEAAREVRAGQEASGSARRVTDVQTREAMDPSFVS